MIAITCRMRFAHGANNRRLHASTRRLVAHERGDRAGLQLITESNGLCVRLLSEQVNTLVAPTTTEKSVRFSGAIPEGWMVMT